MGIGEHIHWFITSACDLECSYCFGPESDKSSQKVLEEIAKKLVDNDVKKVTFTGGEPFLVKNIEKILEILRKGKIYTSVHTNGRLLDGKRISRLKGLVGDIAIPIDSTNRDIQRELRGRKFLPVLDRILEIAETLDENNIGVGYHTVFTSKNHQDIPDIFKLINRKDFAYWRIYEFNDDLARRKLLQPHIGQEVSDKIMEKFNLIEKLRSVGTPEKGYTDSLYAYFLLMEEELSQYNDERIYFVERKDMSKESYAFINNLGDASYYTWFSGNIRRVLGNIVKEDFETVMKRLGEIEEKGLDYDGDSHDEFVEAINDGPLFARYWEGNYWIEEIEEIKEEFFPLFEKLYNLYAIRKAKMENGIELTLS